MRAVTIDSDLATLFTFTPRKPPITPIQEVARHVRRRQDIEFTQDDQPKLRAPERQPPPRRRRLSSGGAVP